MDGTLALDQCMVERRNSVFGQGLVMFAVDIWASWELFQWQKELNKTETEV